MALEWLEYILVNQVYFEGKSIFLTKSGAFLVMGVFFVCSHVAISAGVLKLNINFSGQKNSNVHIKYT